MAEVFGDQEETLDAVFGDLTGLDKVNVEEDQGLSEPSQDVKGSDAEQHAWGIHAWGIPHKANSTRQVLRP